MLLRANNRSGYMRSKPWCFCLSLLFSSLSNKIAHTAASTLRADFIYKLAAASWLCHRLFENADRSCNNSVPLHKKNKRISPQLFKMDRQRRPTWPSPALSPWRLMMSMRMSTTMMVPVLPMPALWEHQARVKLTHNNTQPWKFGAQAWTSSDLLVFFLPPCTKCGLMSGRSRPHRLHNNIINA